MRSSERKLTKRDEKHWRRVGPAACPVSRACVYFVSVSFRIGKAGAVRSARARKACKKCQKAWTWQLWDKHSPLLYHIYCHRRLSDHPSDLKPNHSFCCDFLSLLRSSFYLVLLSVSFHPSALFTFSFFSYFFLFAYWLRFFDCHFLRSFSSFSPLFLAIADCPLLLLPTRAPDPSL